MKSTYLAPWAYGVLFFGGAIASAQTTTQAAPRAPSAPTDAQVMSRVRASIKSGLEHSALTDMPRHTRAQEAAYEEAVGRAQPASRGDSR